MDKQFLTLDWPLPKNVQARITTRYGGFSEGTYAGFNLAGHVGDSDQAVSTNRRGLIKSVGHDITWLTQVHGTDVLELENMPESSLEADAAFTRNANTICAVLTADCVPILLCNSSGTAVAAVHAGWRGLARGVIDACIAAMTVESNTLTAYIGPCISRRFFEVEKDVIAAFLAQGWSDLDDHYCACQEKPGKFFLDLVSLTQLNLNKLGVENIYGGHHCTYFEERFYSHRRDGVTGRFASLIWFE